MTILSEITEINFRVIYDNPSIDTNDELSDIDIDIVIDIKYECKDKIKLLQETL